MYTKEIKSLQHPLVKHLVKLGTNRRYRQECKRLLIEGKKMIEEYPDTVETLLFTTPQPPPSIRAKHTYHITPAILSKIATTSSPEPLLAEVTMPETHSLEHTTPLLALDGISDPGNLGTLIRTALALEFKGVFLTSQSADPYAPKALRAAKGASLIIPIQQGDEDTLLSFIHSHNLTPYVADTSGAATHNFNTPLILILGSESHGPSPTLTQHAKRISIPLNPQTDSLNVAIAGGILMHQIREFYARL